MVYPDNLQYLNISYCKTCHERWINKLNRNIDSSNYKEAYLTQQCIHCTFYAPLTGPLGEDWGACTNPDSIFERIVMFEHDGCDNCSVPSSSLGSGPAAPSSGQDDATKNASSPPPE
jgi:hypothetical protein